MGFSLTKNVQTDFWEVYKKYALSLCWKTEKCKKTQISQYLLGVGAAVVFIGAWEVSATKMIKHRQQKVKYTINILSTVNDVLKK